ncbi:type VII secretion target [Actinomadura rubrisoli]|nr:type VII secretion target [Actinomadura rubrisoli]
MSFRVEPGALETFGTSLDGLSGDAKKAKTYVDSSQQQVDEKSGVVFGFLYTLGVLRIGDAVQKNVARLDALTATSAKELHKCAEVYRHTEKKNAERIDGIYPK